MNDLKKDKTFFSYLLILQYEIYYLLIHYYETHYLNKKFYENSLLNKIFSKDEFRELFIDLLNNKNMFKYKQKIVESLLGSNDENFLKEYLKDISIDENLISKKEINRVKKGKVLLPHNNFADLTHKSETKEYLKYNLIWCIEKIKTKFLINTSY